MLDDEDYAAAEQARGRLTRRLTKYGGPRARRLARILSRCTGCTGGTGCGSGACPTCGFALQRAAVGLSAHVIRGPARAQRGRMTAVSTVPSSGCVAPGELTAELFGQVAAEVKSALMSLDLPPTVLGLDISFNEDLTGELPPHWSVHTHGNVLGWLSKAQKTRVRQRFRPSPLVRRPVRFDLLDGQDEGQEYPHKWQRFRRQRYLATPEHRNPHKRTRPKSLRPLQSVELALVEHRFGLAARVISNVGHDPAMQAFLAGLQWARDGP